MAADPRSTFDLRTLFSDPDMFDSRDRWRRSGFHVFDRSDDNKIMVASHEAAPGYLFKKYVNVIDLDKQRRNYEARIEGADQLRAYVTDRRLDRVAVPHKWLYELPKDFGHKKERSYVLVVERLGLLDEAKSKRSYFRIDNDLLKQLCLVLVKFRGLDSAVMNVPFTSDNRLAFIDTEHWDRHSKSKEFLDHIQAYLAKDSYKIAKKIYERLADDDENFDDFFDEDSDDYEDSSNSDSSSDSDSDSDSDSASDS